MAPIGDTAHVRVVTFNAAAGNPRIKTVETEFLQLPFYREALTNAPGAPILALQEVGNGQAAALSAAAGTGHCTILQKRRPGLGNALVIPARYRVLRARRRYYVLAQLRGLADGLRWWATEQHRPNWRQFGELRIWVEAHVRDTLTQREFTVITTHLSVEPSLKHRQAAAAVGRALRAARRHPVVLAGDMNVPTTPAGRDIPIHALLHRLIDAGTAKPGKRPNIDYVLVDGFEPVSSRQWMGDSLSLPSSATADLISDHYAEDDVLRYVIPGPR
jgi:endonuclease/exonuclease/phosphatase family metal-dependent hydrolase